MQRNLYIDLSVPGFSNDLSQWTHSRICTFPGDLPLFAHSDSTHNPLEIVVGLSLLSSYHSFFQKDIFAALLYERL